MKTIKKIFALLGFLAILVMALDYNMLSRDPQLPTDTIPVTGIPVTRNSPPCIRMYYYIERYATEYNIPLAYAYGIAYAETRYSGLFDWKYNPAQTSPAGAVGPMQIMPATARMMWPDTAFSTESLRTDISFNVRTSMKLLRHLHDKYNNWRVVFGCYNTGRPIVNDYAQLVYNYKPQIQ